MPSSLLSALLLIQWTQGPSSVVANNALVSALTALDKKSEVLRLPQLRMIDASALDSDGVCTLLQCVSNGMMSGLQTLVIGASACGGVW